MTRNHNPDTEQHYDHHDDLGIFDASEIRAKTDYVTDADTDFFTASAIAERTGNVALSGYIESQEAPHDVIDEAADYKHGFNKVAWKKALQDPEVAAETRNGLAKLRAAKQAGEKDK